MHVEILRLDSDDIMVIRELAGLSGESKVGDGRNFKVGNVEAFSPFVFGLVLEFEFEGFIGEVGDFGFRGDIGIANAAGLLYTLVYYAGANRIHAGTKGGFHTEQPASSLALPSLSLS